MQDYIDSLSLVYRKQVFCTKMEFGEAFCCHDYSCALCENKTDLRATCCCKDNAEDLHEITEIRLLKRCNLEKGDRVCSFHYEKIKNGLIFGGGSSGCCAPFHVGPLPGKRLRLVPRTWRQLFDSADISRRYMSTLQICGNCYKITLDLVLNDEHSTNFDTSCTDKHLSSPQQPLYTSPRRWLSSQSLNMPASSSSGSMWSLTSLPFSSKPTNNLLSLYSAQHKKLGHPRVIPDSVKRYLRSKQEAIPQLESDNLTPTENSNYDFDINHVSSDRKSDDEIKINDDYNDSNHRDLVKQISNASLDLQFSPLDNESIQEKQRMCFKLQTDADTKLSSTDMLLYSFENTDIALKSLERKVLNLTSSTSSDNNDMQETDQNLFETQDSTSIGHNCMNEPINPNAAVIDSDSIPLPTFQDEANLVPKHFSEHNQANSHVDDEKNDSNSEQQKLENSPSLKSKSLTISIQSICSPILKRTIQRETSHEKYVNESETESEDSFPEIENKGLLRASCENLNIEPDCSNTSLPVKTESDELSCNTCVNSESNHFCIEETGDTTIFSAFTRDNDLIEEPNSRLTSLSHSLSNEVLAFVLKYFHRIRKRQPNDNNEKEAKKNETNEIVERFSNILAQSLVNFVLQESSYQLLDSALINQQDRSQNLTYPVNFIADFGSTLSEIILQDVNVRLRELNACDECISRTLKGCVEIVCHAQVEAKRLIKNSLCMLQETDVNVRKLTLANAIAEKAISSALLVLNMACDHLFEACVKAPTVHTSKKNGTHIQWLESKQCYRSTVSFQVAEAKNKSSKALDASKFSGDVITKKSFPNQNNISEKSLTTDVSDNKPQGIPLNKLKIVECMVEDITPVSRSFSTSFLEYVENKEAETDTSTLTRSISYDSFFTMVCKPTFDLKSLTDTFMVQTIERSNNFKLESRPDVPSYSSHSAQSGVESSMPRSDSGQIDEIDDFLINSDSEASSSSLNTSLSPLILSFDDNDSYNVPNDVHSSYEPQQTIELQYSEEESTQNNSNDIACATPNVTEEIENIVEASDVELTLCSAEKELGKAEQNEIEMSTLLTDQQPSKEQVSLQSESSLSNEFLKEINSNVEEPDDGILPDVSGKDASKKLDIIAEERHVDTEEDLKSNLPNLNEESMELQPSTFSDKTTPSSTENLVSNSLYSAEDQAVNESFDHFNILQRNEFIRGPQRSSIGSLQRGTQVRQRRGAQLLRTASEVVMFCNRTKSKSMAERGPKKPEEEPEDDDVSDVICQVMESLTPKMFWKRSGNSSQGDEADHQRRNILRAVALVGVVSVLVYAGWSFYNSS